MPNLVKNILTIDATEERLNEILNTIQDDEEGFGSIDFDKIIPMWRFKIFWTKLNADVVNYIDENKYIVFNTELNIPYPVIQDIAKKFKVPVTLTYAGEELGVNCGRYKFNENGEKIEDFIPDYSLNKEEAIRFACDVWRYDYDKVMTERFNYTKDKGELNHGKIH